MGYELYLNVRLNIYLSCMVCELKVLEELRGKLKFIERVQEGFPEEVTQVFLFLALKALKYCWLAIIFQSNASPGAVRSHFTL